MSDEKLTFDMFKKVIEELRNEPQLESISEEELKRMQQEQRERLEGAVVWQGRGLSQLNVPKPYHVFGNKRRSKKKRGK